MKRTEELHNQHKARGRDARKAKKEAVANVAESMHKSPSEVCVCVPLQTVASECSANCVSSLRGSESLKQLCARSLCPVLRRNEQT